MLHINLRPPVDDDWPGILDVANRSVAAVPGAGTQEGWLANRQAFDAATGEQEHWVAVTNDVSAHIVGYVGVERRAGEEHARLFVVTDPADRDDVGSRLLRHAIDVARKAGAIRASLVEYASDGAFVAFLLAHGFVEERRFALPADGGDACVMSMPLNK